MTDENPNWNINCDIVFPSNTYRDTDEILFSIECQLKNLEETINETRRIVREMSVKFNGYEKE